MSCDSNSNKVGKLAGVAAGIGAAAGKFSNSVGGMAGKAMSALEPYKVPVAIAGSLAGTAAVAAAGVAVAPRPVKERVAAAGQAIRDTAGDAIQKGSSALVGATASAVQATQAAKAAAGYGVSRARDAAASMRQAAESARQTAADAAASVQGAAGEAAEAYAARLDSVADEVGPRVAPVADAALGVARHPLARGAAGLGIMAVSGSPVARSVGLGAAASAIATGRVGALAGWLSRTNLAGTVVGEKRHLLFFKGKVATDLWNSSLTDTLNRADLLGSQQLGKGIHSSDGVMFDAGGLTWHRGTSVVDTPGGQRTITHLQSLSLPAEHHYFDRRIGDEQAVGIAARQAGFDPSRMPGYVGSISPTEALCPAWAGTKQAAIRTALYYGERKSA
jgi:hypothetical protein